MSQHFELQLAVIREQLLMMASLTDRNLSLALKALIERDDNLAETVLSEDSQLDMLEVQTDDLVITYIATHAPVAFDCRLMLVTSKISSNLERIGDQAVTIARRAKELNLEPLLKPLIDLPRMAALGQAMLRDCLTALIERRSDLAAEIIKRDKQVDELNRQLSRELTTYMMEDPKNITRAINLLLVSRALERVADHAKNIAEEIFYLLEARDIRHGNGLDR